MISKDKDVEDEYDEDKDDGNADKDKDDGNADKDRNDGNEANDGPSSASLDGRGAPDEDPVAERRPSARPDPVASHRRNLVSGIKEVN